MNNDEILDGLALDFDMDLLAELFEHESEQTEKLALIPKYPTNSGPVSFQQKRLWLQQQLEPQSTAYNVPRGCYVGAKLSLEQLQQALSLLINKHEVLRSYYRYEQDLVQYIASDCSVEITSLTVDQSLDLEQLLEQPEVKVWFNQPFDLSDAPVFRVAWCDYKQGGVLLLNNHHIASDGWSTPIILSDLLRAYLSGSIGSNELRYLDYAAWQQDLLSGEYGQSGLAYWRDYISNRPQPLELYSAIIHQDKAPEQAGFLNIWSLSGKVSKQIKLLCQHYHLTLSAFFMAVYQLVLSRFSRSEHFLIGVPTASRNHPQLSAIVGCFVNTQVYQNQAEADLTLLLLAQKIQQHTLKIIEQDNIPYEWLAQQLEWPKFGERHPYFQALFNYSEQQSEQNSQHDLAILPLEPISQAAKFALSFSVSEIEQQLELSFEVDLNYYHKQLADDLANFTQQVIEYVVSNPNHFNVSKIAEIEPLVAGLVKKTQPNFSSVISLIQQQVALDPQQLALRFGEDCLTYLELEQRSNRLADWLIQRGIVCEDNLGLIFNRSIDTIVSILAVMKAGATCVIIDSALPQQRIEYIVQHSGISLAIANSQIDLPQQVELFLFDQIDLNQCKDKPPNRIIVAEQLAYLLYTSGSTGKPKGVAVSHQALANHCIAIANKYQYSAHDVGLLFASMGFDAGFEQLLVPLISGAQLIMVDGKTIAATELSELVWRQQITVVDLPPAYLNHVEALDGVRLCVVGGEGWPSCDFVKAQQKFPDCIFVNAYGPTEAVITPTVWLSDCDLIANAAYVPIANLINGVIAERQVYVLNKDLTLTPKGAVGELYIGGLLARGYFNNPDLTAERFIANPFAQDGSRIYRTGDVVRCDHQDQLEYIGRVDDQVQIRGFRVELGEVTAKLLAIDGVSEGVVVFKDHRLIAYVVTKVDIEQIKSELSRDLAEYMVPQLFVSLDKLPINHNGKIDRKALPKPQFSTDIEFVAPQGKTEQILGQIWQQILDVEAVGRFDSFFALGGDSISSLRLISQAKAQGLSLSVQDIFGSENLMSLALLSDDSDKTIDDSDKSIEFIRQQQVYTGLSYAEQRQWLLWQLDPQSSAYHIPIGVELKGCLHKAALQQAIDYVYVKHQALRTVFCVSDNGQVEASVLPQSTMKISELMTDANSAQVEQFKRQLVSAPFDLTTGPLFRVGLIKHDKCLHELVVVMHHIVSDGWSMKIIIDDFIKGYQAAIGQQPLELSAESLRYRDFAKWQKERIDDGTEAKQLAYWQALLGDEHPVLELPTDLQSNSKILTKAVAELTLTDSQTTAIERYAAKQGTTIFSLLMSAWHILLYRYSGQNEIRIGMPIANRHITSTQKIVGCFVNTLVIRSQLIETNSLNQVVKQISERLRQAQANQDLPFEKLVDSFNLPRDLEHSPLFQVVMNHQKFETAEHVQLANLQLSAIDLPNTSLQFDLALNSIEDEKGQLHLVIDYAKEKFSAKRIEHLLFGIQTIIEMMAVNDQMMISQLPLIPQAEIEYLTQLGRGDDSFVENSNITELISEQMLARAENLAIKFGFETLTYRELNQQVRHMVAALQYYGIGAEHYVAVQLAVGVPQVISSLAVLFVGATLIPLDINTPSQRLNDIHIQTPFALIISETAPNHYQQISYRELLSLTAESSLGVPAIHPQQLAYMIYTSGSTGKPKGVGVSHQALSHHCQGAIKKYQYSSQDNTLLFASLSFDAGLEQLLLPLLCGGQLHLTHRHQLTVDKLRQLILTQRLTVLDLPPSYLKQIDELPAVRLCIVGGEAWHQEDFKAAQQLLPNAMLANAYGPTEAVITPTVWLGDGQSQVNSAYVPIGSAVGQRQLYILNHQLALCPVGMVGELYIEGTLARGYVGRPDLTAERFVANPFVDHGSRLYRTGDLVRWRLDDDGNGELEYIGRIDHQVKIRGFRIELGEIEAKIRQLAGIEQVVVQAKAAVLVCYYSQNQSRRWQSESLKSTLAELLPEYMVPSFYRELDRFTTNSSGKIDLKVLPDIETVNLNEYIAPIGYIEKTVAKVWQQALQLEQVGRNDSFFDIGGNSLVAVAVMQQLQQQLTDLQIDFKQLWQTPVLQTFCDAITASKPSTLSLFKAAEQPQASLVLLHEGYGLTHEYQTLADNLSSQLNVYVVTPPAFLTETDKAFSMHDIVKFYADDIESTQLKWPLHIAGWSTGGMFALLLTSELQQRGKQVESVNLIDSWLYAEDAAPIQSWLIEFIDYVDEITQGNSAEFKQLSQYLTEYYGESCCQQIVAPVDLADALVENFAKFILSVELSHADIKAVAAGFLVMNRLRVTETLPIELSALNLTNQQIHCCWCNEKEQYYINRFIDEVGLDMQHMWVNENHKQVVKAPELIADFSRRMLQVS